MVNNNLVGGSNHLEKYEFVNGKDDIPYIMENKKCSKPPTSIHDKTFMIIKHKKLHNSLQMF